MLPSHRFCPNCGTANVTPNGSCYSCGMPLPPPVLPPPQYPPQQQALPKQRQSRRTALIVVFSLLALLVACCGCGSFIALSGYGLIHLFTQPVKQPVKWNPKGVLTYRGHSASINAVAWSPDGTRIASGGYDKTVQVWDAHTGQHLLTYHSQLNRYGDFNTIIEIEWSPDSSRIASIEEVVDNDGSITVDTTMQIWDAHSGKHLLTYHDDSEVIGDIVWSPHGNEIASLGLTHETLLVLDASTGHTIFTHQYPNERTSAPVWSSDGTTIVFMHYGGDSKRSLVETWAIPSGVHRTTVTLTDSDSNNSHSGFAFSPDGTKIAASEDSISFSFYPPQPRSIRVWDRASGQHLFDYDDEEPASSDGESAPKWSPNSKWIASGEKTLQIWDVATRAHVFAYNGPGSVGAWASWSPDSTHIASTSGNTVQVWQAPTAA